MVCLLYCPPNQMTKSNDQCLIPPQSSTETPSCIDDLNLRRMEVSKVMVVPQITWVISHVPMFHITQPLDSMIGINGLLDGYYFG